MTHPNADADAPTAPRPEPPARPAGEERDLIETAVASIPLLAPIARVAQRSVADIDLDLLRAILEGPSII